MSDEQEKQLPPDPKVPENLLAKLHAATEHFHQAKAGLETVMGDTEYTHQQRIDRAQEEVRTAESEMEQAAAEVSGFLKPRGDAEVSG